jgi:hypothetical protein
VLIRRHPFTVLNLERLSLAIVTSRLHTSHPSVCYHLPAVHRVLLGMRKVR